MEKRSYTKKRKIQCLAVAGILTVSALLGTAGCGSSGMSTDVVNLTEKYKTGELSGENVQITEEFCESYMDFSLSLLRESRNAGQGGKADTGTMVSPLSVMLALEMTRSGARGETEREMSEMLYRTGDAEKGKRELLAFAHSLPNEKKARFYLANSIWFHTKDTDFVPDEAFLERAAWDYAAQIYGAPFDETTCKDINKWVEQETGGMITDLVDQIPREAIMYLVNALAFEAEWEKTYEKHQVQEAVFYPEDGREQKVSMMYSEEGVYVQDKNATGFCKPYASGYEFVAFLPEEGMTLETYLDGLTGEELIQSLLACEQTTVLAGIPKFQEETDAELSETLKTMGMPLAFDETLADFSGMGSVGTAGEDAASIFINRVLHKTYIRVDELGTKAGAATAVEMVAEGVALTEKEPVILDRPFLYAVVEKETKLPLFIGTMESAQE